jgi:very-short-patch-repair endonuclease
MGVTTCSSLCRRSLSLPVRHRTIYSGLLFSSSQLIIEVDGSQHLGQEEYDAERTAFFESKGYHVLRFWNSDVMNRIDDVMGMVQEALEAALQKTDV